MQRCIITIALFSLSFCISAVNPKFIEYVIKGHTPDDYQNYYIYDTDSNCRVSLHIYHEHYPSNEHIITFEMRVTNTGNEEVNIDKHLVSFNDTAYRYFKQPMFRPTKLMPGDSTFLYNRFIGNTAKPFADLQIEVRAKEFPITIEQVRSGDKTLSFPELIIQARK